MGRVANYPADHSSELSKSPAVPRAGDARPSTLRYGLTVQEIMDVGAATGVRLVAGAAQGDRLVRRVTVGKPPAVPAVPEAMVVLDGDPAKVAERDLARWLGQLADRGCAAVALVGTPAEAAGRAAERRRLPVLSVPDTRRLAALRTAVTAALDAQVADLAGAEQVYRTLLQHVLGGGELPGALGGLADLLDAAVALTGPDGRVLGMGGSAGQVEAARIALGVDVLGRVSAGADIQKDCLSVPVPMGTGPPGRLIAHAAARTWRAGERPVLERAATVLAVILGTQRAILAVEGRYHSDLLRDLLDGRVRDPARARSRAAALGWDLDRPLVVVVAVLDPDPSGRTEPLSGAAADLLSAAWTAAVRDRDRAAAAAGFLNEVVALVGATNPDEIAAWLRDVMPSLRHQTGGRTCSVGVSRVVGRATLPTGYTQAGRAARIGRQLRGGGAVIPFDDLGVFRLLSLIPDSAELDAYVSDTLGELAGDTPEAVDLRRTLRVLLETNLNVSEAARRLHFHYNTLRYRIAKLHRLVGPFSTDPALRLTLHLALHVEDLRQPER